MLINVGGLRSASALMLWLLMVPASRTLHDQGLMREPVVCAVELTDDRAVLRLNEITRAGDRQHRATDVVDRYRLVPTGSGRPCSVQGIPWLSGNEGLTFALGA